jgi:dynein heavy chain
MKQDWPLGHCKAMSRVPERASLFMHATGTSRGAPRGQALTTPPRAVELALAAALAALGRPPGWEEARRALAEDGFAQSLLRVDKDAISDALLKTPSGIAVDPALAAEVPTSGWTAVLPTSRTCASHSTSCCLGQTCHAAVQAAGREPAPARALCEWARALCAYGGAARDAAPRRARLTGAERALAARRADAAAAQAALAGALAAVAALRARARRARVKSCSLKQTCC